MDFFLKIVGILTIAIVVLLALAALYIFLQWRKIKKLSEMGFDAMEVELEVNDGAKWTTFDKAQQYKKSLNALGFKEAHAFSSSVGLELWVFLNQDFTHAAAITHTGDSITMEFSAIDAEKETAIDVTDNPDVAALTPKPYKISIGRPNLSPEELHKVFIETVEGKILKPMPPQDLKSIIESQFKKEMASLTQMGGSSETDVDNLLELWGENLSEEDRNTLVEQGRVDNQQKKWALCLDTFSESSLITPKVWSKYEDCMVIVTEDDDLSLFSQKVIEEMCFEDSDVEKVESLVNSATSSEALMELLKGEFTSYKITLLGEINEPLPFKVFGFEYPEEY